MTKYIALTWPEYEKYLNRPELKDKCIIGTSLSDKNITYLMIPYELYRSK